MTRGGRTTAADAPLRAVARSRGRVRVVSSRGQALQRHAHRNQNHRDWGKERKGERYEESEYCETILSSGQQGFLCRPSLVNKDRGLEHFSSTSQGNVATRTKGETNVSVHPTPK